MREGAKMNIHKQLKAIRQQLGITQTTLAKRAQCTQKQVSFVEGGKDCYISTMRAMLNEMGYDLAAVPVVKQEGGKDEQSQRVA